MCFKFVFGFALVIVSSAVYVPQQEQVYHAAPVTHTLSAPHEQHEHQIDDYDPHPQYKVSYNVHDSETGDVKSQSETRDGDVVNGEYSLIDADGYKRTVSYSADAEHGFKAVVNRVPLHENDHTAPHAASTAVKHLAPVVHAAPLQTYTAPAPVKTNAAPTQSQVVHAPATYSPPSYHQTVSAPVDYSAPNHHKTNPETYTTASFEKTVTYGAPTHVLPSHYYEAPVNYHAHPQTFYVAPAVAKSAASSQSHYNSAPEAQVQSESYSSPAYVKSSEHNKYYHH